MTMRFFVGPALTLSEGLVTPLPPEAAKHAQVRRVQPGDELLLFDGRGSDWPSRVLAVGRSSVDVEVGAPLGVEHELPIAVTLAVVVPANERMDSLVEKATELGVARLQPLMAERSVLRLSGERASRRQMHWQAVAVAASEQCGRTRVPQVAAVCSVSDWLTSLAQAPMVGADEARWLLSLAKPARPPGARMLSGLTRLTALSGPEGGLTTEEEAAAVRAGFAAISLGPRTLRADTAPMTILAWLGLSLVAHQAF